MKYTKLLNDYYEDILAFVNAMSVGIWITNNEGKVVLVNDESLKAGGLGRDELMGKTMEELIDEGYVLNDSSCLRVLASGHEETYIQEMGEGGCLMAISRPLYDGNSIDLVVCVERNITEVAHLITMLEGEKELTEKYKSELLHIIGEDELIDEEIVSYDRTMVRLKESAVKIGEMDVTVVITGESGTGKEVFANLIQKSSKRRDKPFIKVNCAAIPESLMESELFGYEKGSFTGANEKGKAGLFELANEGTIFLDEIGELPIAMQSKLLRVLQDMEVRRVGGNESIKIDVRVIAATNKNLKEEIKKGTFRSDLYYRLFVVPINIPALRHRKGDITPLTLHFVSHFNDKYGLKKIIGDDAISELEMYDWPGNVRELRNILERLVVSGAGNTITGFQVKMCLEDVSQSFDESAVDRRNVGLSELLAQYERQIIMQTVEEHGSISAAARTLKVNKSTISRKMKEYNTK